MPPRKHFGDAHSRLVAFAKTGAVVTEMVPSRDDTDAGEFDFDGAIGAVTEKVQARRVADGRAPAPPEPEKESGAKTGSFTSEQVAAMSHEERVALQDLLWSNDAEETETVTPLDDEPEIVPEWSVDEDAFLEEYDEAYAGLLDAVEDEGMMPSG